MIKHMDKERVIVFMIVTLLLDSPIIYWIIFKLYNLIIDFDLNILIVNPSAFIVLLMMLLFTNYMRHLIMESNFVYINNNNHFTYKTLLWFKHTKINFKEIKKVIICRERVVFYGDYESIIVIRKGLRRNIFFTEFSMKKEQYKKLKEFLTNIDPKKVVITKKRYIKPLLALFGK